MLLKLLLGFLLFSLINYHTVCNGNGIKPERKTKVGFLMVKQNLDIEGSIDFCVNNLNIITFYCYMYKQMEDHGHELRQPFQYTQDCDLLQFVIVHALLKHRTFFHQVPYFLNFCARVTLVDFISDKIIPRMLVEGIIHVVWCEVAGGLFIHGFNQPYFPIQKSNYMYESSRISYVQDCDLLLFVVVCALLKHRTFFHHVPYFLNFCARVTLVDFILDKIIPRILVEGIIHVVWCEVAGGLFFHKLNQSYSPIQNLNYMYELLRSYFHRPRLKCVTLNFDIEFWTLTFDVIIYCDVINFCCYKFLKNVLVWRGISVNPKTFTRIVHSLSVIIMKFFINVAEVITWIFII